MFADGPEGCRGLCSLVRSFLALTAVLVASSAAGQTLFSGSLACAPNSPSVDQVGYQLFTGLTAPLNQAWQQKVEPKIEGNTFVLNRVHVPDGCSSEVTDFCATKLAFSHCSFVYVDMTMHELKGLKALQFTSLFANGPNERNVSAHTSLGPDVSVLTDGVFAPEGWSSTDTAYAIVLPHNQTQGALVIDLGATKSLCGVGSTCNAPKIQADNDDVYQVDYSTDGTHWSSLGAFPTTGGSGLHTRSLTSSSSPKNFSARYLALYATSGGNTFAVSELQLFDTSNNLVTLSKPVVGLVPYEIVNGVFPATGHSSTDPTVSVVLVHKTGSPTALSVDLGSVTSICGTSQSECLHEPTIEADNDDTYMLDYSLDGQNWTTYGNYDADHDWHSATFAPVSGSGLHTRDMSCSARPDLTTACSASNQGPDFKARYLRVYARTGGNTFAVAELELWDSAGNPLRVTPTYTQAQSYAAASYVPHASGPEPFYINGDFAPEGTSWDDPTYATKLGACTATNSCAAAAAGTAAPVSSAKQIDLTAVFPISSMTIQADNNDTYQVDGWDGTTLTAQGAPAWIGLWTVPTASNGGLRTRTTTTFSVASPTARYVRVYATKGDGSYSVSELQVFTSQAKTAGTYADVTGAMQPQLDSDGFAFSDGRANDGQGFACTYDGTFNTDLTVVQSDGSIKIFEDLPITYTVDSVSLNAHCVTDTSSGDYNIASATNRTCSMTLIPPAGYGNTPFTDTFQAGQCASPADRNILSYLRFDDNTDTGDNSAIQFISKDQPPSANPNPSDLQCSDMASLDAHIPAVLRGFVPSVATEAVRQGMNALLDFHNSPFSLVPFPVVATNLPPPQPATKPVECDDKLTVGEPSPAPDNISGIAGKATQVGSGSDNATVRITGNFTVDQPVALDQAALSVHSLLQEVGLGERVEGPDGGAILLPIGLDVQSGSKPSKGMYRTPPGAKPMVSARIDANGTSMSFEIDIERASIAQPEACLKGLATARVRTAFVLVGGSTNAIQLQGTSDWQCKGAQLVTP